MASPTPVLPEVGSTIVPPGLSFPSASAFSIMASPMRSLTEPPGFRYSSLASRRGSTPRPIESSRTIGVSPTSSRTEGYSRAIGRSLVRSLRLPVADDQVVQILQHGDDGMHAGTSFPDMSAGPAKGAR